MNNPPKRLFLPLSSDIERVGRTILDSAFTIHTRLGPGLLESVYRISLKHVIENSGTPVETEVVLPIEFDGVKIDSGLRLDMLVDKRVIVELKSVEKMNPLYDSQLMTYLRLSGVRLGYLINFNVRHLKDGIKRIVV